MADTPHPDSLAAWATRIVADDSIKEAGPLKGPAKMVMELIEGLRAQLAELDRRERDARERIDDANRDLRSVLGERVALERVVEQMGAAPAEPVAKATRRRKDRQPAILPPGTELPPAPPAGEPIVSGVHPHVPEPDKLPPFLDRRARAEAAE